MDFDSIERLMRLLEASSLDTLDVTEGDMRIRLSKSGAVPAAGTERSEAEPARMAAAATGEHLIVSGLPGTFYRAAGPDRPPYIAVGDVIAEGQVIGLIEAMKTFNPIESDRAGKVSAILVDDGGAVTAGMPLVALAPAEALP